MKTTALLPFAQRYIEPYKISLAYEMCKLLQRGLPRMILKIIHNAEECNVTFIIHSVNAIHPHRFEQAEISQCLAKLRKHNIVKATKDGRNRNYTVDLNRIEQIRKAIELF